MLISLILTHTFLHGVCRKVMVMEDSDQNIHLRNLSMQQSTNEEEALNLLFLGDTNRMIAEVRNTGLHCTQCMNNVASFFHTVHCPCSLFFSKETKPLTIIDEDCRLFALSLQHEVFSKGLISPCLLQLLMWVYSKTQKVKMNSRIRFKFPAWNQKLFLYLSCNFTIFWV